MSKLTEIDMLLAEVNKIIEEFDDKKIKRLKNEEKLDPLEKIRRDISALIIDIDTLLDERDKIPLDGTSGEVIQKKYRNQIATENKLNELKNELDKFSQEINSMKKNKSKYKSKYNISILEEQLRNFGEQYEDRRSRLDGIPVSRKNKVIPFNNVENLDRILEDRKDLGPEREMYQEEKEKIDAWKDDIKVQDKQLEEVAGDVKKMRLNVKDIEKGIDKIGRNIEKTNNMASKSQTALEKTNKKLKEILEKVGGPANFCVDIVLICVCLGLIAVLYNLIRTQTSKTSSSEPTTLRFLGSFE